MRALLISGSNSVFSYTRAMMEALDDALVTLNVQTVLWDLHAAPLPIASSDMARIHGAPDPQVVRLLGAVRTADAFALGSPLYHGSFSGVLKNALDLLSRDAFRSKPVALLSHGSSERRCAQPCEHLQAIVSAMGGYSLRTQVATAKSDFASDPKGRLVLQSHEILQRVDRQARELVQLAKALGESAPIVSDEPAVG